MKNSAKSVVEKMFAAFGDGYVEQFVATVSNHTVWIYHGTQIIPKGTYEGKEGTRNLSPAFSATRRLLVLNLKNILSRRTKWSF